MNKKTIPERYTLSNFWDACRDPRLFVRELKRLTPLRLYWLVHGIWLTKGQTSWKLRDIKTGETYYFPPDRKDLTHKGGLVFF